MVTDRKKELSVKELLSRQDYLVVQGNDLARAFGGLKAFEHSVLDYCFSFVTKDSKVNDEYEVRAIDIIKHLGLSTQGANYKRIGESFKKLNENTALYLPIQREDGVKGILMTQLFSEIQFFENGIVRFKFSEKAAPLIFDLRENFYSFRLADLANIKGKYAKILLKLWESNRYKKAKFSTVKGTIKEWNSWLIGKEKTWPAGRLYTNALKRGVDELEEKLNVSITVTKQKRGKNTVGYELVFEDTSILEMK